MKPNEHKNCGGKMIARNKHKKSCVYICNRCGWIKTVYKRIKGD